MIESGVFRRDLFYRLNVFPLELPPLRERKQDIPLLLDSFTGGKFRFDEECMTLLTTYSWPGNIRELNNVAQYISTVEESTTAGLRSLPCYLVREFEASAEAEDDAPFNEERLLLEQKTGLEPALQVLEAVRLLNDIGKTAGRKHLLELLGRKGAEVREARLKTILETLRACGLIVTGNGRSGSRITGKGRLFLPKKW
jgi:DNA-binding NtrC family response regulator